MQHELFGTPRDLDLRSNADIDLSRSSYIWFDAPSPEKHDGVRIIFLSSESNMLSSIFFVWLKLTFFTFRDLA